MTPETQLSWVNEIRIWAAAIAAFAALVTFGATYMQLRLQSEVSARKDELAQKQRQESDERIALATAQAATANERAAEANKIAEQERLARVKLEAKVAPRRLTREQVAAISAALETAPSLEIGVVSRMTDTEGKDFADDFAEAFDKHSRWKPVRFENWTKPDRGVYIARTAETGLQSEVGQLVAGLISAGIDHRLVTVIGDEINRISPSFQPGFIYLLIGAKP